MPEKQKSQNQSFIECPQCGTKNSMRENVCFHCSANLSKVKEVMTAKACKEQYVKTPDGSLRFLVIDDVRKWAEEARSEKVCVTCGRSFDSIGTMMTFPCSFCGGSMCRECMGERSFTINSQLLTHLSRIGLNYFPGWAVFQYSYGLMELNPGYYLCKNCVYFINGPEFTKYLETYYKRTGRLEELAELREYQGMLDDAKRIRITARSHAPPDLEKLIDKLKEEGLAVPYRCPSCGANITIDSKSDAEGLKFCSYCGSAVNVETLASAIVASLRF